MSLVRPRRGRTFARPVPEVDGEPQAAPAASTWIERVTRGGRGARVYLRIMALLAVALAALSVGPVLNKARGDHNKDYSLWYWVGWNYARGADLYPTDGRPFPFMYPPTAAALLAVASGVGEWSFVPLLLATNAVAWVGSVVLSVKLATGSGWRQAPLLYVAPTLWVAPFIHDMFLLGQPNLLLLFLLLGAFAALRAGREWSAGSLVALAAGIKAFPILAVAYLLYRRRWKALAATGLVGAALLWALPAVFRGPGAAWSDLAVWTRGMVLKYDEGQIAQRPERCYSFKNQSVVAVANRLLRDVPADGEKKDGWQINVADLSFRTVNGVVLVSALGLGLFYLAAMPLRRPGPADFRIDSAETAMLILLILAFSPFAFNYFYVWLLYPLTVLLARLLEWWDEPATRRVLAVGLLAGLGVYALSAAALRTSQAYGNLLALNLLLLLLLSVVLRRVRVAPAGAG
jgi:hypothetical protein